jgi:hypothetical protein
MVNRPRSQVAKGLATRMEMLLLKCREALEKKAYFRNTALNWRECARRTPNCAW